MRPGLWSVVWSWVTPVTAVLAIHRYTDTDPGTGNVSALYIDAFIALAPPLIEYLAEK